MERRNHLTGKSIVITGASSGAGRAAALEFAPFGPNLILASRNEVALNELAEECRVLGAKALVVPVDVTDAGAMENLAKAAQQWNGQVDVWINNAGVLAAGDFDKTPMEVHHQVIETNLLGYMNGAHAILPIFKEQKQGIIINNISVGGFMPVPYGAGYTASKFGLTGFSEALKGELTGWPEIHICDLFPAFLDTPGIHHAGNYTGKVLKPAPPFYDPKRLAQAMAGVIKNPKSNTYIGSVSLLLKLSHALMPEITAKLTKLVMRKYFDVADSIPETSGNVFNTVKYGMSTHGGFGIPGKPKAHRKYIAGALLAGLATSALVLSLRK